MPEYKTEQERFWATDFGDAYAARNRGADVDASNLALFSRILARTTGVASVLELGANIGLNMRAMHQLLPAAELSAVEINETAAKELRGLGYVKVYHQSLLDFKVDHVRDMTLIKGVLIHINPSHLPVAYELLYRSAKRYVCVAEYYNPSPVEVSYRGHSDRLFKRDFAGEMMDAYNDLRLVDYGFVYRRDPNFAQDDITWFLMEKQGAAK
jgi:spore coat polysaccharide biosynthesis protein SpsF